MVRSDMGLLVLSGLGIPFLVGALLRIVFKKGSSNGLAFLIAAGFLLYWPQMLVLMPDDIRAMVNTVWLAVKTAPASDFFGNCAIWGLFAIAYAFVPAWGGIALVDAFGRPRARTSKRPARRRFDEGAGAADETIIESTWGALGAIILLQCHGLIMLNVFWDLLRNPLTLIGGPGLFFVLFLYLQAQLLNAAASYLRAHASPRYWLTDLRSGVGIVRAVLLPGLLLLYVVLFAFPSLLRLSGPPMPVVVIYQILHPLLVTLGKRMAGHARGRPLIRLGTVGEQVTSIVACLTMGSVFLAIGVTIARPVAWFGWLFGGTLIMLGLLPMLLSRIRPR